MDLAQIHASLAVRKRTEQYQHETRYSDGHIYCKLREYAGMGRTQQFHEWHERLSQGKQYILQSINQRRAMAEALDRLMPLPGVIDFLQLGSYSKVFYYRLREEIVIGLNCISVEWSRFTLGDELLQASIDRGTVESLEGRAPAASELDRQWVHVAFKTGRAFPAVTEPRQRRELERRVQMTTRMIPSLRSLQSNLIYLSVAADIMWLHVLTAVQRQNARAKKMSLRETLRSCWTACAPYVEVREGEFQPALGPPSFDLAYSQLMLSALRQFPYLSDVKPKGGKELCMSLDRNCVALLHRRARLLGFHSSAIAQGVTVMSSPFQPQPGVVAKETGKFNEVEFLSQTKHRWGRPSTHIFRIIQTCAFLPTILRTTARSTIQEVDVLQDLFTTSFSHCGFDYDLSRPCVSLNTDTRTCHDSLTSGDTTQHMTDGGPQTIQEINTSIFLSQTANAELDRMGLRVMDRNDDESMRDRTNESMDNSLECHGKDLSRLAPQRRDSCEQVFATGGHLLVHSKVTSSSTMQNAGCSKEPSVSTGPRVRRSSDGKTSTGSRCILTSPPAVPGESSAVQHPIHTRSQLSLTSSSQSLSPLPSPSWHPLRPMSPVPTPCQRLQRAVKHSTPRLLPLLKPATTASNAEPTNTARAPFLPYSTSSMQSVHLEGSIGRQEAQHEGNFSYLPLNSSSLPRSTVPSPLRSERASVSLSRANSEARSLWSSQCQQTTDLPYPSQLTRIPTYLDDENSSISSRSTLPALSCRHSLGKACCTCVMSHIHEFLRGIPRGSGSTRPAQWQNFNGSEGDIESISL